MRPDIKHLLSEDLVTDSSQLEQLLEQIESSEEIRAVLKAEPDGLEHVKSEVVKHNHVCGVEHVHRDTQLVLTFSKAAALKGEEPPPLEESLAELREQVLDGVPPENTVGLKSAYVTFHVGADPATGDLVKILTVSDTFHTEASLENEAKQMTEIEEKLKEKLGEDGYQELISQGGNVVVMQNEDGGLIVQRVDENGLPVDDETGEPGFPGNEEPPAARHLN